MRCDFCQHVLGEIKSETGIEYYCNNCKMNQKNISVPLKEKNKFEEKMQEGNGITVSNVHIYAGPDCGIVFLKKIFQANQSVMICSPWISIEYAVDLVKISKRGVKVYIITSNQPNNEKSLELLEGEKNIFLKVKGVDKSHSKIYIADSDVAVMGSVNMTTTGLKRNQFNHIAYTFNENSVKEFVKIFKDLYEMKNG